MPDPKDSTTVVRVTPKNVETTLDSNAIEKDRNSSIKEDTTDYSVKRQDGFDNYARPETNESKDNLTPKEENRIGRHYRSEDTTKLLADSQGWLEQVGHAAGRVVTDFLGGTIQGFGATAELAPTIYDVAKGQDVDFNNALMQLGQDIQDWGKKNMPIYHEHPNQSWDIKDPAFWIEGAESAFSTLQFLLPIEAGVKGVGMLAKLTKAEELVNKAGKIGKDIGLLKDLPNTEQLKYFSKIGTGAVISRNAENMQQSMLMRQNTKQNLLDEWKNDPNELEKLKDSDIYNDFSKTGKEFNADNMSNFLAGRAGWTDYMTNSANVLFDAVELAPLFKGFDPETRKGFFNTSNKVRSAEEKVLGKEGKYTFAHRVGDYLNPMVSGVGRSLSEGVEEFINDIADAEANNQIKEDTGKGKSSFSSRLVNYLKTPSMYESAFWGVMGGALFQGVAGKVGKITNKEGTNTDDNSRIEEVLSRPEIIKEQAKQIKDILSDDSLDDNTKKDYVAQVKSGSAFNLGLQAAQTGNINGLVNMIKSPEFKANLIDQGIAKQGDVDKAIAKTVEDVLTTEKLYKKYYNGFFHTNTNDTIKNGLINKSAHEEFGLLKNKEYVNKLQNELADLKVNDNYINNTKDLNVESTIHLKALEQTKKGLKDFLNDEKLHENGVLFSSAKQQLEKVNEEIAKTTELIGDKPASLIGMNPDIIDKQNNINFISGEIELHHANIKDLKNPETIEQINKQFKNKVDDKVKDDLDIFKSKLNTEIKEGKHTVDTLTELKKVNKDNKAKSSYVDAKIKEIRNNDETKNRKEEVKKAQIVQEQKISSKPVNERKRVEDEYSNIPQFENNEIDETTLEPTWKNTIDALHSSKNMDEMQALVGDYFFSENPNEGLYARNKFQDLRNKLSSVFEVSELNSPVETGKDNEFELDEENQIRDRDDSITLDHLIGEKEAKEDTKEDSSSRLDFLKKIQGASSTRLYIPAFAPHLKGYSSNHFYQIKEGNILINDDFENTFKTLFGKDLQKDIEVNIEVDIKNPFYSKNKESLDNVPIKISYKGVTLAYLDTIKSLEDKIKQFEGTEKGQELALELPNVKQIREKFKGVDTIHNSEIFNSKVIYKGNGTVISRGTKQTALRSIDKIFNDFYILNPGSTLDTRTIYNATNENDFFSSTKELKQGTIYGMLESANGTKIPVPLFVSKVTTQGAINLQKNIDELLTAISQGKTTEHQEVKDLKDNIAKYIKVDRQSQFDKPIGFRVYPKGKNEKGEATEARIVMTFFNSKGIKHTAVIKKDDLGLSTFSVVKKKNGEDIWTKNPDGTIYKGDVLDKDFREVLERKYNNIDINKLKSKEEFKVNGKTYDSYKDYLINEEIVQTDIAQVLDSSGNVLSNLFGFNNDFSLEISSNLYKEGEDKKDNQKIVDDLSNLLMTSAYEKEFSNKDTQTDDLEYRKNYSLYSKKQVNAETLVREVLKNPLNDNIKDVAKWLSKNLSKIPISITIGDLGYGENNFTSASYKSLENKVVINNRFRPTEVLFQQTVLHELIHSVTVSTMFNNMSFNKNKEGDYITSLDQVVFKKYCPKYVKDFVIDISSIRDHVVNQLTKKYGKSIEGLLKENIDRFYGLENIQEFISEVMTNSNFRNEIRSVSNNGLIHRIYNSIVEFLNKVFGSKFKTKESEIIKNAVDKIKNFVDNTQHIERMKEFDIVFAKKLQDKFDNEFSREEINEILNTTEGVILNIVRNKKVDLQASFDNLNKEDSRAVKDIVFEAFNKYSKEICPESCKAKMNKVLQYDRIFVNEAIDRINRCFKITGAFDIDNIQDTQEVTKEWNDRAAFEVSSQDTITNQIKLFVKMTPELSSLNTTYTEDGKPIWDRKKSTTTGMNKYVDFNTIYPYMVRNLIGTGTPAEIVERLNKMAKVYPSFAYMANELSKDSNLLAQIESNMGKKYAYDSYVTFLSAYDEGLTVRIDNEAKDTRHDILLANQWVNNINRIIDSLDTSEKKKDLSDKVAKQYMQIVQLRDGFENNIDKITELTFDMANNLGVNLSLSSIESQLKNARNWNDFKILKTLEYIFSDINVGKKNNSFGNLNYLADIESIFTFDIVENSVLSIEGKPLYTIRNPHFISNWFSLAKSETAEGKQEFETLLRNYAQVPDMQLSNWLWNEKDSEGFLNYEITNGQKVIKNINWDFINKFSFHNFGGAKETITKTTQQYTDFSEKDWMMINLFNHIQGSKKKGFIQVPALIPSDSGSMFTLELPKIALKKEDYHNNKLSKNSELYKAIRNTVRQEIRRIQQATSQVFDIIDNQLSVKKDLNINTLQQYFHYGKKIEYNEDGTIDLHNTLLDKNNKPKGKAYSFQNMSIKEGDKLKTINDLQGIFINNHLEVGEVSQSVIDKIDDFTNKFIDQQVSSAIRNYQSLETNVAEKHDNIGNGNFENLVAEYVLNQYIANVEQFNLFNGVIAEYKDKVDTNKRAKQMFAPGIALSVESMKMKIKNGSFTDGRSFRAVTIADVNTKSHTIKFIISSIKEGLIKERKGSYSKSDINNFNDNNLVKNKPDSKLEKDTYDIIKGYLSINAGDAQGYITIDRYEGLLKGLGRWNKEYQDTFESIRSGKQLTSSQIKTLQPIKGFYYGREYDSSLNRFSSNQIKYSTIPLIPQLVSGTQMEKLMEKMEKDGIDEAFFESAHKIGAKRIYKIHNEDGTINDKSLKDLEPTIYLNKNWQLQLDVPEHLMDEENLLATQIAKLVIANIHDDTNYNVGELKYNGKDLKNHYFKVLDTNIVESANKLLDNLGVYKTDNGFHITNNEIQRTLIDEIEKRGLSENYRTAIELDERGNFNLPLFANNMSYKWEAILTSLFTNRITNQKMPGGSSVLASRLFLDNKIDQSKYEGGIEWSKDKEDRTLKSYRNENGIQVVEVIMGAWTKKLYKDGQRVSIDDISDDIKTMIGYRIPTEKKSSMFVFKIVGFLPEESKGTIITPDDLINQAGWDFDVDKVFIMNKNFYINDEGKYITPTHGKENSEFKDLLEERKKLLTEQINSQYANKDEASTALSNALANHFFGEEIASIENAEKEIESRLNQISRRLSELGEQNEGNFEFKKDFSSRQARENEIFNIYHSILTNEAHIKETLTPSGFEDFIKLADEINEIFGEGDNSINPLTEEGQRTFRKRNISGRALKGIAANFNSFGAVAQHTKMKLADSLAFKFKFDLSKYDKDVLSKRYKDSIDFKDNFAYIDFKNLGFAPNNSYLNVDGDLILEKASQGIAAAVDIVKNPTFDAFNATTYTYPVFHTMLLSGVPSRLAGMFIRQPIIKRLNDYYFDNKSLLGDKTGNQIETIKRFYQTALYNELIKFDKNNKVDDLQKTLSRREKAGVNVNTLDRKFLVYIKREDTEKVLKYNPDSLHIFDVEELKNQLEIVSKGMKGLKGEDRIKFYTNQLMILEYFNTYKKAGEGVQDVLQVTKVDGLGAGPTMMITNELNRKIEDLRDDTRVYIDDSSVVDKIYPRFNEESVYSPLQTYLNYSNRLSVDVLRSLFIQQSNSFKNVVANIASQLNRNLSEEDTKNINKFTSTNLLQAFDRFRRVNKIKTLGINMEVNNNDSISITDFKNLSTCNKVVILQKKHSEFLKENSQHILNFLIPNLDKDQIEKNGYHKLDFVFYKNEFTDDNLSDSILKMYESGNEFDKDLAEDLINYTFVSNGLTFGLNSFAKVIPNELLKDWGLGDYLYKMQEFANRGEIFRDKNTIELFFRNNWNNTSIVPIVRTRWHYKTDKDGKRYVVQNEDGEKATIDNSPNWESDNGLISISDKRFKNLDNNIRNSPYVLVSNKEDSKLYKKFSMLIEGLDDPIMTDKFESTTITPEGKEIKTNDTFYYQVDRLGKDGINEFDIKTNFNTNKSSFDEQELTSKLEVIVSKMGIKKVTENLDINNSDDSELHDKINECDY